MIHGTIYTILRTYWAYLIGYGFFDKNVSTNIFKKYVFIFGTDMVFFYFRIVFNY